MGQSTRQVHLMGTIITLQIEAKSPEPILDELVNRLKIYDHRFSANDPSSELMAITKQAGIEPVVVNPELYKLIEFGLHYSLVPQSRLNIAIGPLVQTWRIGFTDAKLPTPEEIVTALNKTNPLDIVLDGIAHSVFLKKPGMAIDLGSLAKGYIADMLVAYLKQIDVTSAMINLGGNVLTMGPMPTHADHFWRIGIQDPAKSRGHYKKVLQIRDQSVVTSGIYERQLVVNGKKYHHILDARTGYPVVTDLASLTIIADKSLDCELWTTRLFGQPSEISIATINQTPNIEGIVIDQAGKVFISAGLE
ncbi:FAD:protein FMN transferase [Loigolactobacillus backii]|uniref:FAD:protein FMN transferase n=1 Tax=Loigolactobacillus backii TaxID=375175 RepID=A0A192H0T5_9LACO|nr:FAD:protein FMN transferase [Loigolactobacillus backii]ANK60861.1 thiamine biosynthesis protein ApbE [Loigolactobacillus backii]ANK61566.1 thiamine biosynthesis protein ApbE [Loigolactobacillus backii]ANK65814.1 thiamine biosynthesis protein ApbE [Loigolactobacillus backii]ANK68290.1 thiamine biosynthesis protein ApbE [Loigolactobacillus backii]ANK69236.1 thiamine biosynthesis protein ApbE [Loigolactobacillus backii]